MNKRIKNFLKYLLMLAITGFLLWLSYTNIQVEEGQSRWDYILSVWSKADKPFLFLSAAAAILSHMVRAERWKLMLFPMGHRFTLLQGFMSVMVGYFINLVIPRGGEVSRCYNLYRLNKTPVDVSLGTVVGRGVNFIIPVSLEKLIPVSIREVVAQLNDKEVNLAMGLTVNMMPTMGKVVTEIEAFKILTGVEAVNIGAGGVGGAEGARILLLKGDEKAVTKAFNLVQSIKGEPTFKPASYWQF